MVIILSENKFKITKNKKQGIFFLICLAVLFLSIVFYVICSQCTAFAEWFSKTISAFIRTVLANVTNIFPFSVGETLTIMLVFCFLFYTIYYAFSIIKYKKIAFYKLMSFYLNLISVCFLLTSFLICGYLVLYKTIPLEKKMKFSNSDITSEKLFDSMKYTIEQVNSLSKNNLVQPSGASVMPYSKKVLCRILNASYENLADDYDFLIKMNTKTKIFASSMLMTYTHTSGIYIPFSGEANVNINFPDYIVAFTYAHEMAHQRGIASEDEANFIGFLACINSNDEYLQYCGYMNMADYLFSAVYKTDQNMHKSFYMSLNNKVIAENNAYYEFFEKYTNSKVAEITNKVNDVYLKSQGQESGILSYSQCVNLLILYYNETDSIN